MELAVALSGSGFRLSAHVGALQAILDHGIAITAISGVSGGSIIAAAFAVGMQPKDMLKLAHEAPYKSFIRFDLEEILFHNTLNSGSELLEWLHLSLGRATTFKNTLIPLSVIATDLNKYCSYVFSNDTTPDYQLAMACRWSSSIPLVFEAGEIDGHYLVDGGVSNDLPLNYLPHDKTKLSVDLLESSQPLSGKVPITVLLGRILDTFMEAANEQRGVDLENTIPVRVVTPPGLSLDTSITYEQIEELYKLGYEATAIVLAKHPQLLY